MLDRETLADVSVNAVPLAVLLGFALTSLLLAPWGYDPRASMAVVALIAAMSVGLVVVTAVVARRLSA